MERSSNTGPAFLHWQLGAVSEKLTLHKGHTFRLVTVPTMPYCHPTTHPELHSFMSLSGPWSTSVCHSQSRGKKGGIKMAPVPFLAQNLTESIDMMLNYNMIWYKLIIRGREVTRRNPKEGGLTPLREVQVCGAPSKKWEHCGEGPEGWEEVGQAEKWKEVTPHVQKGIWSFLERRLRKEGTSIVYHANNFELKSGQTGSQASYSSRGWRDQICSFKKSCWQQCRIGPGAKSLAGTYLTGC